MEDIDDIFTGKELDEDVEEKSHDPVEEEGVENDKNGGEAKEPEPMRAGGGNKKNNENEGEGEDGQPIEEATPERKGNEEETEDHAQIGESKDLKGIEKTYKGKRPWIVLAVLGICLSSGAGFVSLVYKNAWRQDEKSHLVERFKVPKRQNVTFDSFIIPFRENDKFTYISLSITFNLPNKEVREEVMGKKEWLRGILYDVLKEKIKGFHEVPSIESLKGPIRRGINEVLSTGKVHDVYIEQFLAG